MKKQGLAKWFESSEEWLSMFLGVLIVGLVVGLVINYFIKRQPGLGSVDVPGLTQEVDEEIAGSDNGAVEEVVKSSVYKVKRGDSLWKIAERELGNGNDWVKLAKINGLSRPGFLAIGQEISLDVGKELVVDNVVNGETSGRYVVVAGDSLWKIAVSTFGDGYRWVDIWKLNKNIRNPNLIMVGAKLLLPEKK